MSEVESPFFRTVQQWGNDLWRYVLCGAAATATDYAVWGTLVACAKWPVAIAVLVSRPAGGLVSFAGNRWWTWRRRRALGGFRQFQRFWMVWAGGYVVTAIAAFFYARALPDDPFIAKIAADLTAGGFGFLAQRAFTFR